jgi:hypothetical protein
MTQTRTARPAAAPPRSRKPSRQALSLLRQDQGIRRRKRRGNSAKIKRGRTASRAVTPAKATAPRRQIVFQPRHSKENQHHKATLCSRRRCTQITANPRSIKSILAISPVTSRNLHSLSPMINQLHNAPLTNTPPNHPDRNMKYDPSSTFHIDFREWVLCYLQNGCGEFVGFEVLRGGVFEVGGFVLSLALGFVDSSIGGLEVWRFALRCLAILGWCRCGPRC